MHDPNHPPAPMPPTAPMAPAAPMAAGATAAEPIQAVHHLRAAVLGELRKMIVGQEEALDAMLLGLFASGHVLLEGVPGTAKTLMVRALSRALGLEFGRIQFTPDLMPSDVVGTHLYDARSAELRLHKGPIFTELLLADEINRAPAKTQSALLEAMQERQVSIDGTRHTLSDCFTVFATQNPVEQEGTYPLPEAQLDRFLVKIHLGYPTAEEEDRILAAASASVGATDDALAAIQPVANAESRRAARQAGAMVRIEEDVRRYLRELIRATRSSGMISLGAGPRAAVHLLVASRWVAAFAGRDFVIPDDIVRIFHPVIGHRLVLSPEVELDGLGPDEVLYRIADRVPVPR